MCLDIPARTASLIPVVSHGGTKSQSAGLVTFFTDVAREQKEGKERKRAGQHDSEREKGGNGWTWNRAKRLIEKIYGQAGRRAKGAEKMRRAKRGRRDVENERKNGEEEKIQINRRTWRTRGSTASRRGERDRERRDEGRTRREERSCTPFSRQAVREKGEQIVKIKWPNQGRKCKGEQRGESAMKGPEAEGVVRGWQKNCQMFY